MTNEKHMTNNEQENAEMGKDMMYLVRLLHYHIRPTTYTRDISIILIYVCFTLFQATVSMGTMSRICPMGCFAKPVPVLNATSTARGSV